VLPAPLLALMALCRLLQVQPLCQHLAYPLHPRPAYLSLLLEYGGEACDNPHHITKWFQFFPCQAILGILLEHQSTLAEATRLTEVCQVNVCGDIAALDFGAHEFRATA